MNALLNWLDDRTGYRHLVREALYEPIPGGARWRYVWGSTLVFTFFLQVITGVLLWTAYAPSAQTAWESIYFIQHEMTLGWMVRGIHHFAAQAMIVLLVLHFMQVIVDGAYKAPREVNFWLGIILLKIVLGLSLTGYLLPWDQKGYYATKVATNMMGVTPVAGEQVQTLVQGGTEYGHHTLTRFFALHAGVLPGLLIAFLALHIYVFRRHAITPALPHKNAKFAVLLTLLFGPIGTFYSTVAGALVHLAVTGGAGWLLWRQAPEMSGSAVLTAGLVGWFAINAVFALWARCAAKNFKTADGHFWPDQLLKDAVACLAVLATVMGLTLYYGGAELSAPADPTEEYAAARPEWYFLFLFRFLKVPGITEFIGAIVVPGALMGVIVLMPILGRWKLGHRFNVGFLMALLVGAGFLTGLAIWEDVNNPSFQKAKFEAERDGHRTVALAKAYGIPIEGAQALLRDDPLTQGPKLFARNCASCHRYDGHDGTGSKVLISLDGKEVEAPATAADLGNFGSRQWIESVLVNYKEHFAPLENAVWDGENVGSEFLDGDMADWSEDNKELLTAEEHQEDLAALVEFMFAQGQRQDQSPADADLVEKGREIYEFGELSGGAELTMSCVDCHSMHARGEDEPISLDGYGPNLTGYGSREWLRSFLSDPGSSEHYGDKNAMPAFESVLTEQELDLLVRWMTGDYYREPASAASQH